MEIIDPRFDHPAGTVSRFTHSSSRVGKFLKRPDGRVSKSLVDIFLFRNSAESGRNGGRKRKTQVVIKEMGGGVAQ